MADDAAEDCARISGATGGIVLAQGCCNMQPAIARVICERNQVTFLQLVCDSTFTSPRCPVNFPTLFRLSALRTLIISGCTSETDDLVPTSGVSPVLQQLTILNCNMQPRTLPSAVGSMSGLTSLLLSRSGFTGSVPDSFSNLRRLQVLDLSNNNLEGTVPTFLADLPALTSLTLRETCFDDINIPASVIRRFGNGFLSRASTCAALPPPSRLPSISPSQTVNPPNDPSPSSTPPPSPTMVTQSIFETRTILVSGTIITTIETAVITSAIFPDNPSPGMSSATPSSSLPSTGGLLGPSDGGGSALATRLPGGGSVATSSGVPIEILAPILAAIFIAGAVATWFVWRRARVKRESLEIVASTSSKFHESPISPQTTNMVIQETSPSTKSPSPVTEHLASTGGLFDSLDRLQPLPTLLKAEEASVSLMMDGADQEIAPQDTDSSKPSVNSVDNISIPLFTPLHVPPNHPVLSWSTDDVAQWMQSVGIRASIAELFAENGIDGFSLPRLNHSILSEDLGITSPQLRSTLLLGIEELFSSPLPSFVPSLAPNTDPDPGPESRGNEIDEDEDLPPPYLGDRRDRS